ncbi:DEAD/DEAH box helicase [Humibacillus sp. DSM 29435]|uniref:DEAD/DEAH box helicase n=1 Tax=Humibacillus sp. DSM 29435 TaxID=1869167 RepID=UPI000872DF43|nr:DEAD/DEAH box helicase [Humibacillus sp. DSM 29435]OFE17999.1 DEAD/DEAH box helicase [Humibacillus sp. DSM 29435]
MPKKSESGAPKKARWSTEKKSIAAKKPHRGQSSQGGHTAHAGRTSRPASATSSHVGGREWRAPRDEHRSFERNDRATSGSERPSYNNRDDRGSRPSYNSRDDRGSRPSYNSRDDRGERPSYNNRDDRGSRPSYSNRDDRPAFKRDDRGERPSYNNRDDRGSRPSYNSNRDDRPAFKRDDRGERPSYNNRDDRSSRPSYNSNRDDRPAFKRDDRSERPSYNNRDDRGSRPSYNNNRDDRSSRPSYNTNRDDRPAFKRDDRGERPSYNNRDDRSSRPSYNTNRDDRPAFKRDDRGERPSYNNRDDRSSRPSYNTNRDDRDSRGGYQRRDDRGARGTSGFGDDHFGHDAEAERMDADTWTKSTRADVSDGPVEVASDNGFAALGLPEKVVERLAREGITTPFPIQTATIPDALLGKDVLGRGQTGSGKTLAFGLPLIARLLEAGQRRLPRRPHALILTPTRELAMQISDALEPLVHVAGLRHKLIAGGLSYTTQINALNKGVDILIATPGRLNDLLERGAVEMNDISITVLDEADHMAEMGFMSEITTSLDQIPSDGQRLLFSATLDNGIDKLVAKYLTDPVTHSTNDATASVEGMDHHVLLIDPQHKKLITAEVANRDGRTLVFCRTKLGADRIALQLREQGVMAAALHGGLNQGQRNRVLGAFRDGGLRVLVATDVAARGIHVDDVSVVLQVDPPADHKDYLHRAGRTARAGEKGTVVTLALPHQRKTMERQLKDAGLDLLPVKAAPGDDVIAATGATRPSGTPIDEAVFNRLVAAPKARRAPAGPRGPRPASSGRGGQGHGRGRDAGRPTGGRRDRDDRLVTSWSDDTRRGRS